MIDLMQFTIYSLTKKCVFYGSWPPEREDTLLTTKTDIETYIDKR